MSAPLIILASLPSFCQKSSKLVEIWQSSDKYKFAQFFLRHGVYLSQLAACTTTTNRREQNIIYLYALVNLKRNLRSTCRTIEATERHEASRDLFATAGLLVTIYCQSPGGGAAASLPDTPFYTT